MWCLIMRTGVFAMSHGACSCSPLKYTNIDIAGHLPDPNSGRYSGNPVLALSYCYLIQGKCLTVRNDLPCEMQYVCEVDCKPVCMPPCQTCVTPIERSGNTDPRAGHRVVQPNCQPPCQQPGQTAPCRPPPCPDSKCQPPGGQMSCQEQVMVVEPMCQPNVKRNGLNTGA